MTAIASMWASVIFALAGAIVFLWGTEIPGAAQGGWDRAKAQASAERNRFSDATREARAGAASAGDGLRSAFSRAKHAAGALRSGMRGPRAGASPGSRVPAGSGAAGRIGRAALVGATLGARRAARAAKRAKSRSWRRRSSGSGTRSRRVSLGVCDNCGVIVARASLKPSTVQRPGGAQKWKLCVLCRKRRETVAAEAVPAAQVPAGKLPQQPGAEPLPGGERHSLHPGGSDGAALPVAAAAGAVTGAASSSAIPAGGVPASVPAGSRPALTQGANPMAPRPITAGRPSGTVARRAAASPAVARDSLTHGGWTANVKQVIAALIFIGQCKQAMIAALKDQNASETQIRDVQAWADHLDQVRARIRAGLLRIDGRLEPHILTIEADGGWRESADAGYLSDY